MKTIVLLLSVAVYNVYAAAVPEVSIPSYGKPCKKSDPNLNDCVLKAIKGFIPAVAKQGARDIGIPPLEPFYMAEQILAYNKNDMQANVLLRNIFIHGASKANIKAVRANFDDSQNIVLEADVHFPEVFTEGTYKMDGHIGSFLLNGKGVYNMSVFDVNDTIRMEAKVVKISGEEFLKATKMFATPQIGDMKIFASNLINGNPELSAMANQFVNQFWRLFYAEALPVGQEYFDKISRAFLNKALLSIPYKHLISQE